MDIWLPIIVYAAVFIGAWHSISDIDRCPECGRGGKDEPQ